MDTVRSAQLSSTLTFASSPAITPQWQLGQRVDAIVMSQIAQDRLALKIGSAVLEAQSSLEVSVGQRLSLEVVQTGKQIVLRIIPIPPQADPVMVSLRTMLPQQLPLQLAFARFSEILVSNLGLPPAVTALLKQLLQQLPSDQTITRDGKFKQSLIESGQFLESQLVSNAKTASLNRDIKANLLRLLDELVQSKADNTEDLTRHVGAALARIQLHQLSALMQEEMPVAWAGELPIRHGDHVDVLQLRIEKDTIQAAEVADRNWYTLLSFNLRTLGPLHAKIALSNQVISTTFWAESKLTADLVNEHLSYLHQVLQEAGLEVKDIQCRHGHPPFSAPDRIPKGLLDITV